MSVVRDNWKHLRVPYQLTLAPLFLWGWFLSGVPLHWRFVPGFVSLHLLLYTGITALNSYYDRDEGPVGGLEKPPQVHESLFYLAISLKSAAFLLACLVGTEFTATVVAFMLLSFFYSLPQFRWKAHPVLSTLVVSLGQGGLGFLAGWAAARGELHSAIWDWKGAGGLGFLSASLTALGMYPVTQVFQIEEDARRGDRTLCVVLGAQGALVFSALAFSAAGAAAFALAITRYTSLDALILLLAYAGLLWYVGRFRLDFESLTKQAAFRRVLLLNYAASGGFLVFILAHFVGR